MLNAVENARLYLPPEDPERPLDRVAVHPETNAEQVLMDAEGTTLEQFLGNQVIVSAQKPADRTNIMWMQITATRLE